jgi:hypothetical protein
MARPPVESPISPANSVTGRLREGADVSATNLPLPGYQNAIR